MRYWLEVSLAVCNRFCMIDGWLRLVDVTMQRTNEIICRVTTGGRRAERCVKNWRSIIIACCRFASERGFVGCLIIRPQPLFAIHNQSKPLRKRVMINTAYFRAQRGENWCSSGYCLQISYHSSFRVIECLQKFSSAPIKRNKSSSRFAINVDSYLHDIKICDWREFRLQKSKFIAENQYFASQAPRVKWINWEFDDFVRSFSESN